MPSMDRITSEQSEFCPKPSLSQDICVSFSVEDRSWCGNPNLKNPVHRCGLPLATYFSATKLVWLLENVKEVGFFAAWMCRTTLCAASLWRTTVLYPRLRKLQKRVSWCLAQLTPGWFGTSPVVSKVEGGSSNLLRGFQIHHHCLQARDRCDQCLSYDADGHCQSPVESRAARFLSPSLGNPPSQDTGGSQIKSQIVLLYLFSNSGVLLKFWKSSEWSVEGSWYFGSRWRPTGNWSFFIPIPVLWIRRRPTSM